jgi:hypothetical protein
LARETGSRLALFQLGGSSTELLLLLILLGFGVVRWLRYREAQRRPVCTLCHQRFGAVDGCTISDWHTETGPLRRIAYGKELTFDLELHYRYGGRCTHCHVRDGFFHHAYCEAEECPMCGEQLECECSLLLVSDPHLAYISRLRGGQRELPLTSESAHRSVASPTSTASSPIPANVTSRAYAFCFECQRVYEVTLLRHETQARCPDCGMFHDAVKLSDIEERMRRS